MKFEFRRLVKLYYLRLIGLRGEPHELALGMALGVFCGMMPIMPFQTVLAVALALVFKGSKITAALGTWVSNPFVWYFLYFYSYKLGAFVIGLPEKSAIFSSIMAAVKTGEEPMVIVGKILGSGTAIVAAFLLGGLIMGIVAAGPSYFLFLQLFSRIKTWRRLRKERRNLPVRDQ